MELIFSLPVDVLLLNLPSLLILGCSFSGVDDLSLKLEKKRKVKSSIA